MQLHAFILLFMVQEVVTNSSGSDTSLDSAQSLLTTTSWPKTGASLASRAPSPYLGGLGAERGKSNLSWERRGSSGPWSGFGTSLQDQGRLPTPRGAGMTMAGIADRTARPLPQEEADNGADMSGAAHITAGHSFAKEDKPTYSHAQHTLTTEPLSLSPGTVGTEPHVHGSRTLLTDMLAHADREHTLTDAAGASSTAYTGELPTVMPTSAEPKAAQDMHTATYATQSDATALGSSVLLPPTSPQLSILSYSAPTGPPETGASVTQHGGPLDETDHGERQIPTWRTQQSTDNLLSGQTLSVMPKSVGSSSEPRWKDLHSTDAYNVTVPSPTQRPTLTSQLSNTDSSVLDIFIETPSSQPHYGQKNSSVYVDSDIKNKSSDIVSTDGFTNEEILHTHSTNSPSTATPAETQNGKNLKDVSRPYITINTFSPEESSVSISPDSRPEANQTPYWTTVSPGYLISNTAPPFQKKAVSDFITSTPYIDSSDVTTTTVSDINMTGEVVLRKADTTTSALCPGGVPTCTQAVPDTHAPLLTSSLAPAPLQTTAQIANIYTDLLKPERSSTAETAVQSDGSPHPTDQHLTSYTTSPLPTLFVEPKTTLTHVPIHTTKLANPRGSKTYPLSSSTAKVSHTFNYISSTQTTKLSQTLTKTMTGPVIVRGGNEKDLMFITVVPSQSFPSHPATHSITARHPEQPSPRAGSHPSQDIHLAGTSSTSPIPNQTLTTQPPRFYIVPDQPAAIKVGSIELLLQIILEESGSALTPGLEEDMNTWLTPYLLKAPGFSKLLGIWSRGLVVQSLVEFQTSGALVWLGKAGPVSLLECTGLAQAVREGWRFRGLKVTNITVGGLQGGVCDWLLQCPAGYECVLLPGRANHSCTSVCNFDYCHHHGICTHHPGQLPVCRCLVGDHFWYMGQRCDVKMTRARLVGACLAILFVMLTLIAILAFVAVRRYRAMLIQAKVNQTRSSYRRFNHFDELSGRFWLRSSPGSADSLDNPAFTRSDELLHMRALDRTCCYHDDTLSLASTCQSNGTHLNTVFPNSSQYGWRGSEVSMVDCVLDSGKASDLSVCSWPVEPIQWSPFPLLQQLASHRTATVGASRTRSYCEGMELVDLGKSWTA